ncbi:MAG: hypothetical protein ACTSRH_07675 [Promethearchaeota archaeon]
MMRKKKVQVVQIWDRQGLFSRPPQILGFYVIFLFITLHKMIDQVFEQILEDNSETPRGFYCFQANLFFFFYNFHFSNNTTLFYIIYRK